MVITAEVVEQVDQVARRIIIDALTEATAAYWHRRAEAFELAKPRLDDFHGQATHAELSAQWRRADETAKACRNRASLALVESWDAEVVEALAEVRAEVA